MRCGRVRNFLAACAMTTCGLFAVPGANAQDRPAATVCSADEVVRMNSDVLAWLYQQGHIAPLPSGKLRGTAIVLPGSRRAPLLSKGSRFVWQGKVVRNEDGTAVNKFFGVRAVKADVYEGTSWMDGKPALVLDYRERSLVYSKIRDEIRQVGPGLYLGVMYKEACPRPEIQRYFLLETETCCE